MTNTEDKEDQYISKTQRKKAAHELRDLAKSITEMAPSKRQKLDLPQVFLDAIEESKRITSHIARKRHFQYMGKLLLKLDHESIINDLTALENMDGHYQIRDEVINLWIEAFPEHESALFDHLYQHHEHDVLSSLRQTLRNHRKKPEDSKARKKLFQALRQLDTSTELPNPASLF